MFSWSWSFAVTNENSILLEKKRDPECLIDELNFGQVNTIIQPFPYDKQIVKEWITYIVYKWLKLFFFNFSIKERAAPTFQIFISVSFLSQYSYEVIFFFLLCEVCRAEILYSSRY